MMPPMQSGPTNIVQKRATPEPHELSISDLRSTRPRKADHPAFRAMLDEARAIGWPTRFARDLSKWDREALAKQPTERPFVWCIGPDGTFLAWRAVLSDTADAAREAVGGECKWHSWDGSHFRNHENAREACNAAGFNAHRLE